MPQPPLLVRRLAGVAVGAAGFEVAVFERRSKGPRLPQQVADERAAGARDAGEQIGPRRDARERGKIEFRFVSRLDPEKHSMSIALAARRVNGSEGHVAAELLVGQA